jgi:hypothetical protein
MGIRILLSDPHDKTLPPPTVEGECLGRPTDSATVSDTATATATVTATADAVLQRMSDKDRRPL